MPPPLEALEHIVKLGSKVFVKDFLQEVWRLRDALCFPAARKAALAEQLSVDPSQVTEIFAAARYLVRECAYNGCDASTVLGPGFNAQLAGLFDQIIGHFLVDWQQQATQTGISLPKLIDVDWRVDVKTSGNAVSRMAAPSALVQMQVAAPQVQDGLVGPMQTVTFEMNKETLQSMLDGLGKIREQLQGI